MTNTSVIWWPSPEILKFTTSNQSRCCFRAVRPNFENEFRVCYKNEAKTSKNVAVGVHGRKTKLSRAIDLCVSKNLANICICIKSL